MAKDPETGAEPRAKDGAPAEEEGLSQKAKDELAAARAKRGGNGNGGGSVADRARAAAADDGDDDDDGDDGAQTELPLNIPGAKKPSLSMNARGKPVSVEGKMRGKSFKMSGVVDDTDRIMEARVLIRFHKDQRVPVRDGVGEAASTQSFVLRQEFDVLRMDVLDPPAAGTGTNG